MKRGFIEKFWNLINGRINKCKKEQPNKSSCNNLTRLTAEKSLFCKTHVLEHLAFIDGRLIAKLRKISTYLRKMVWIEFCLRILFSLTSHNWDGLVMSSFGNFLSLEKSIRTMSIWISFVKIWIICHYKMKAIFLSFWCLYCLFFDLEAVGSVKPSSDG